MQISEELACEVRDLPTKSARIRRLAAAGLSRADIGRYLGVRYQQVRNVLAADEAKAADDLSAAPQLARLDAAGRLLVPAALRRALGVGPNDTVVLALEDGMLAVRSFAQEREDTSAALRAEIQGEGSLVDELIADRRAEAARES